jgi:hypothetical protein
MFVATSQDSNADEVRASELAQIYHALQHEHSYRSFDCGMELSAFIFND